VEEEARTRRPAQAGRALSRLAAGLMAVLANLQGLIGLSAILLLAWGLSEDRSARPSWRWIGGALLLQFAIAVVVTRVPFVWTLVGYANAAVSAIEAATLVGSSYMFGYTGGAPIPFLLRPGAEPPVIIAFQILPLIIVFSALSALLWHWGVLCAGYPGPCSARWE
jgi:concentrative nucleoside transporter, CNT family